MWISVFLLLDITVALVYPILKTGLEMVIECIDSCLSKIVVVKRLETVRQIYNKSFGILL